MGRLESFNERAFASSTDSIFKEDWLGGFSYSKRSKETDDSQSLIRNLDWC